MRNYGKSGGDFNFKISKAMAQKAIRVLADMDIDTPLSLKRQRGQGGAASKSPPRRTIARKSFTESPAAAAAARRSKYYGQRSTTATSKKKVRTGRANTFGRMAGKKYPAVDPKPRSTSFVRAQREGIALVTETGGFLEESEIVYMGHSTTPYKKVLQLSYKALIKKVFNLSGYQIQNFEEKVPFNGASLSLYYYNASGTLASVTASALAAQTFEDFADNLDSALHPILIGAYTAGNSIIWVDARLTLLDSAGNGIEKCRLMLDQINVHFVAKSMLKMQNQSVTVAADNEADDVNNVPIQGKSYYGSSNRFILKTSKHTDTVPTTTVDINKGFMTLQGTATQNMLEPLEAKEWRGVKTGGKIRLNPGEIKTSVIEYGTKMDLQRFWEQVGQVNSVENATRGPGRSCLYAFEKLMDYDTSTIKVCYEIQNNYGLYFSKKKKPLTQRIFEKL